MNEFMGRDEAEIWFQSRMDNKQLQRDLKETEKLSKMTDQQIANERAKIANKTRKAERRWESKSLKGERTNRSAITRYSNQKKAIDQFLFDEKIKDLTTAVLTGSLNPKQIKHIQEDINRDIANNLKKEPIKQIDTSGASILTEAAQTSLGIYSGKAEEERAKYRKIAEEWNALIGENLSKNDALKLKLEEQKEHLEELEEAYKKVRESGGEASRELLDDIEKTTKGIKKTQEEMKPSFWEKLFNTFKRIGFYRLARDFFRIIVNAFKEGIQLFATFDKSANETMSDLTGSFAIIKASISSMLITVVQMFTPAVRDIATAFAEVANTVSKAAAALRGAGEYTKINTDYMKEYGQATKQALLSFDKFEALTGDADDGLFSTEKIDELDDKTKAWKNTLATIKTIIEFIWDVIKKVVGKLAEVWKNSIEPHLDEISAVVYMIIDALAKVVMWLIDAALWVGRNLDVAAHLLMIVAGIVALIAGLTHKYGLMIKALSFAAGTAIGYSVLNSSQVSSGTVSTPSTGTSQTNSGMVEVMTEAITTTSQLSDTQQADLNIYLDSQKIGGTKLPNALADEMSRRKLNLNVI